MENQLIELSQDFWHAIEHADEAGMRAIADPGCQFVHIGTNASLNKEINYYTTGVFSPTEIVFRSQKANVFGDTGIVLSDVDYGLLLDGQPTTHHFMVTEVFNRQAGNWKLVQFSFTALVY